MSIGYTEFDFSHSLVAGSVSLLVPAGTLACTTNIFIFLPTSPRIPSGLVREAEPGSVTEKATELRTVVLHGAIRSGFFWTKTGRIYGEGISRTEKSKYKDPEAGVHLLCLGSSMEARVVETVS